jgi:hypothetical protein
MWAALLHWHSPSIQISVRVKGLRKLPTGIQELALSWTDQIIRFSYLQFELGTLNKFSHGWPRLVSYHMVEVIDPKICPLSSESSGGYSSHHPSQRGSHDQADPCIPHNHRVGPGRQWHVKQYMAPDRPSKMDLWPADTQGLSVSKTAHYSLKNSLGIPPIVLLL